MGTKTTLKDVQVVVRMAGDLHKALAKEAEAENRPLANYIRKLLTTHQDRQKKKN